jgi:hypothetical protein
MTLGVKLGVVLSGCCPMFGIQPIAVGSRAVTGVWPVLCYVQRWAQLHTNVAVCSYQEHGSQLFWRRSNTTRDTTQAAFVLLLCCFCKLGARVMWAWYELSLFHLVCT